MLYYAIKQFKVLFPMMLQSWFQNVFTLPDISSEACINFRRETCLCFPVIIIFFSIFLFLSPDFTGGASVAFSAALGYSGRFGPYHSERVVIFKDVITRVGEGYDPSTGVCLCTSSSMNCSRYLRQNSFFYLRVFS